MLLFIGSLFYVAAFVSMFYVDSLPVPIALGGVGSLFFYFYLEAPSKGKC